MMAPFVLDGHVYLMESSGERPLPEGRPTRVRGKIEESRPLLVVC